MEHPTNRFLYKMRAASMRGRWGAFSMRRRREESLTSRLVCALLLFSPHYDILSHAEALQMLFVHVLIVHV